MSFLIIVALIATCQISGSHVAVISSELVSELFQFSVSSYTSNWKKLRLYVRRIDEVSYWFSNTKKAYNKRLRRFKPMKKIGLFYQSCLTYLTVMRLPKFTFFLVKLRVTIHVLLMLYWKKLSGDEK